MHPQLVVNYPDMGADGGRGDRQFPGNLGDGQLGIEQPQHLHFPLAERLENFLTRNWFTCLTVRIHFLALDCSASMMSRIFWAYSL